MADPVTACTKTGTPEARDDQGQDAPVIRTARLHELEATWDAFINQNSQGRPYHRLAWLRAIESAYGHAGWGITAEKDGQLAGVLPLVQVRRPLGGSQLVSLPFCDYGGVVCDDAATEQALLDAARQLAGELGARQVEIRSLGEPGAAESDQPGAGVPPKVSMQAPLPENSEALFKSYKPKLRSQIRKAQKNGLECRISTAAQDIEGFYRVFAANMHRLGSPVHSRDWFQALCEQYGERLVLGQVFLGDQPVGGGIVLVEGAWACIPWASTLAEYNRLAPNMLLYWTLLSHVCDAGCRHFDFGRSTLGEGTYRFKKQWGAQPVPLEWYRVGPAGERQLFSATAPSPLKQRLRQWIERAWGALPLPVANHLGPRLRKYITL